MYLKFLKISGPVRRNVQQNVPVHKDGRQTFLDMSKFKQNMSNAQKLQ